MNVKQNIKTAQSRMGEETRLTRDVPKLNGKEILLWAGRKPPGAGVTATRTLLTLIRLYHGLVL